MSEYWAAVLKPIKTSTALNPSKPGFFDRGGSPARDDIDRQTGFLAADASEPLELFQKMFNSCQRL
ncbi:hypothetical protein [Microcoleus sp. LEGE 07076]|uniref:hypothetical protein n=1 Tax=Microcoleus sp. LEGE 07076 TaxID=915322 RepID=UPI00188025A2|nr:hypothetical protein [Microcoleus sp. LEGE 07076]